MTPSPPPARTAELLKRFSRLIRASEHETGLNPVQWDALRYIARANRFSRNPSALTAYLGATKGTVSQTLKVLQRRGLIVKQPRAGRGRAIALSLSETGEALLRRDPLIDIEAATVALGTRAAALPELLGGLLGELQTLADWPRFGSCRECRYLERSGTGEVASYRCGLWASEVDASELERICHGQVADAP